MRANLIQARNLAGLTQKAVAEVLGITIRHYQRIEAGDCAGRVHTWDALEKLLKTPQQILRADNLRVLQTAEKNN